MTEPLERYKFIGDDSNDPSLVAEAIAFAEGIRMDRPQLTQTPEIQNQIAAMGACMLEFGANRGIDLSNRIASPEEVHVVSNRSMIEMSDSPDTQAMCAPLVLDIAIREPQSDEHYQWARTLSRYILRQAAIRPHVLLRKNDQGFRLLQAGQGFNIINEGADGGAYYGFNEYLINHMNDELIRQYWPRKQPLQRFTIPNETALDIPVRDDFLGRFGAELTGTLIERSGNVGIVRDIERAYFTGDFSVLDAIEDTVGPGIIDVLKNLRTKTDQGQIVAAGVALSRIVGAH
jgi:hypothetical protein